ncbi:MAG: PAS domain-containing protein [Pseudomonadota bacterium]
MRVEARAMVVLRRATRGTPCPVASISKTLSRFVRESPIALTLASPSFDDCPLVLVNAAFSKLTGYSEEYALGRNCRFLQGSGTEQAAKERLRNSIGAERDIIVPITNYRRDGTKFRNLVFVFPIFDTHGTLLYMMGSQYDITAPTRALSPLEYGEVLDEAISLSNPMLANEDHLLIRSNSRLAEAVSEALEGI